MEKIAHNFVDQCRSGGRSERVRSACRLQQHHQRPRATLRRSRLYKCQHFLLLCQPALNPAFEHRCLAGRAQSLAVHHAHTAQALLVDLADELAELLARLVNAQAVQIDLRLDGPLAAAQLARDVGAHPGPAIAQVLVGVEQGARVEFVAQGFLQGGLLVALALDRQGLGFGRLERRLGWGSQRLHRASRAGAPRG